MLAEEKMYKAYIQYSKELENNILERILHCKPDFLNGLVVDLLIKMGYGYDNKSGKVVGKSHDGGVDGIIQEDKLDLATYIYKQKDILEEIKLDLMKYKLLWEQCKRFRKGYLSQHQILLKRH